MTGADYALIIEILMVVGGSAVATGIWLEHRRRRRGYGDPLPLSTLRHLDPEGEDR